jgi:hypothetical protein
MAAVKPTTAPHVRLTPTVSIASPAAPVSRAAAAFREREAQLQTRADAIKREIEPALGYRGMGFHDWELDAYARALASESPAAQDAVLRLVVLRTQHELAALGDPDAPDASDGRAKEAELGCVF